MGCRQDSVGATVLLGETGRDLDAIPEHAGDVRPGVLDNPRVGMLIKNSVTFASARNLGWRRGVPRPTAISGQIGISRPSCCQRSRAGRVIRLSNPLLQTLTRGQALMRMRSMILWCKVLARSMA